MGDCAVTFKISIDDMNNLNDVINEIKKIPFGKIAKIDTEEIGFGIKIIKAVFVVPDEEGNMTKLENYLKGIKNIKQIDTVDINLL
ncbi:elongation factor 1-beta [Candidatus Micrarchaeota archaeon]|nr:elongation factor 1-beta [Candidatus Micrarchaeota archaeon]